MIRLVLILGLVLGCKSIAREEVSEVTHDLSKMTLVERFQHFSENFHEVKGGGLINIYSIKASSFGIPQALLKGNMSYEQAVRKALGDTMDELVLIQQHTTSKQTLERLFRRPFKYEKGCEATNKAFVGIYLPSIATNIELPNNTVTFLLRFIQQDSLAMNTLRNKGYLGSFDVVTCYGLFSTRDSVLVAKKTLF